VIALGYRGDSIRAYFEELGARRPSRTEGPCTTCYPSAEPGWTVELVETGLETQSGGRIKRLAPYLDAAPFMLTWCDGLSDVDLHRLRAFHEAQGRLVTLTAIHPPARFGRLRLVGDHVAAFQEKVVDESDWINGAFFVVEPGVFEYIGGDDTSWERGPLARLAAEGELVAYRHEDFWQCMDTLHEAEYLGGLWEEGAAPWKIWE
jgi:glucose-1-phosphate cytidylyltransferase